MKTNFKDKNGFVIIAENKNKEEVLKFASDEILFVDDRYKEDIITVYVAKELSKEELEEAKPHICPHCGNITNFLKEEFRAYPTYEDGEIVEKSIACPLCYGVNSQYLNSTNKNVEYLLKAKKILEEKKER